MGSVFVSGMIVSIVLSGSSDKELSPNPQLHKLHNNIVEQNIECDKLEQYKQELIELVVEYEQIEHKHIKRFKQLVEQLDIEQFIELDIKQFKEQFLVDNIKQQFDIKFEKIVEHIFVVDIVDIELEEKPKLEAIKQVYIDNKYKYIEEYKYIEVEQDIEQLNIEQLKQQLADIQEFQFVQEEELKLVQEDKLELVKNIDNYNKRYKEVIGYIYIDILSELELKFVECDKIERDLENEDKHNLVNA